MPSPAPSLNTGSGYGSGSAQAHRPSPGLAGTGRVWKRPSAGLPGIRRITPISRPVIPTTPGSRPPPRPDTAAPRTPGGVRGSVDGPGTAPAPRQRPGSAVPRPPAAPARAASGSTGPGGEGVQGGEVRASSEAASRVRAWGTTRASAANTAASRAGRTGQPWWPVSGGVDHQHPQGPPDPPARGGRSRTPTACGPLSGGQRECAGSGSSGIFPP